MARPARHGWLLLLAGCSGPSATPAARQGALPPGVVAEVASEPVALGTVQRIAAAQGLPLAEARQRAVSDALFAAAARADPTRAASVAGAERSALARALLEQLRAEAHVGLPTDDEVRALTEPRWPELDRPVSAQTAHAVVLVKTPAADAPARALAAELALALSGATTGDELIRRANLVPKRSLEIIAEHLPPVTLDGRLWDPQEHPPKPLAGTLDLDFTRAANALVHPGDQSGVVKSAFGYHVILLEARHPELRVPFENRREMLANDAYTRRAKHELDSLLTRLHAATPVTTDRAIDALTSLVSVSP